MFEQFQSAEPNSFSSHSNESGRLRLAKFDDDDDDDDDLLKKSDKEDEERRDQLDQLVTLFTAQEDARRQFALHAHDMTVETHTAISRPTISDVFKNKDLFQQYKITSLEVQNGKILDSTTATVDATLNPTIPLRIDYKTTDSTGKTIASGENLIAGNFSIKRPATEHSQIVDLNGKHDIPTDLQINSPIWQIFHPKISIDTAGDKTLPPVHSDLQVLHNLPSFNFSKPQHVLVFTLDSKAQLAATDSAASHGNVYVSIDLNRPFNFVDIETKATK